MNLIKFFGLIAILVSWITYLSACGALPFYTYENKPLSREQTFQWGDRVPSGLSDPITAPNDLYIGIALSGGGSRAANFSAAVLFELQEFGILPQNVQAISSVSGSSLTAAYYGLFHQEEDKWNRDKVKKLLLTDFEGKWMWRLTWPHNIIRYAFTDYDRSDVMKTVFDDVLFENQLFSAMSSSNVEILINATEMGAYGKRFVFRGDDFRRIHSDINSYPISHAVMASGAFPGAFHNVTVKDFSYPDQYLHLYDGGPSDNLGIETLEEEVRNLNVDNDILTYGNPTYLFSSGDQYKENSRLFMEKMIQEGGHRAPVKGCFLFIVDAHTESNGEVPASHKQRDTRRAIDFLIDRNALHASDELLRYRVNHTLKKYGLDNPWEKPYGTFVIAANSESQAETSAQLSKEGEEYLGREKSLECSVAVFNFERIRHIDKSFPPITPPNTPLTDRRAQESLETYYKNVSEAWPVLQGFPCSYSHGNIHKIVKSVPTRYFLTSTLSDLKENPADIQRAIFDAAEILIWDDTDQRNFICTWFEENGAPSPKGCQQNIKDHQYFNEKWELREDTCRKTRPHLKYEPPVK